MTRRMPALSVEFKRDGEGRMTFDVRTPEGSISGRCRKAPMVEFTFDVGKKTARLELDWPTAPNEHGDHYTVTPIGQCPQTPPPPTRGSAFDILDRLNNIRQCVIEGVTLGLWGLDHYQRWRAEHPNPQGVKPSGRHGMLNDFERAYLESTGGIGDGMHDLF